MALRYCDMLHYSDTTYCTTSRVPIDMETTLHHAHLLSTLRPARMVCSVSHCVIL